MELQFIHTAYPNAPEYHVGLEIATIFWGLDIGLHFQAESFDVGEVEAFEETFAAGYVVDPKCVEDVVRDLCHVSSDRAAGGAETYLDELEVGDAFEAGVGVISAPLRAD